MSRVRRGVLDRREGGWAVVHLEGGPVELPGWMVPSAARDGDPLTFLAEEGDGAVRIEVSVEAASSGDPRARAAALQERLRGARRP